MTIAHTVTRPTYYVNGYRLASPIQLSSDLLRENGITVRNLYVNSDNYSVDVEFRVNHGLMCDVMDELELSSDVAADMMLDSAAEKLEELGIRRESQNNVRLRNTEVDSWIEIDCTFFLEPKKIVSITPVIGNMVRFDFDDLRAQASVDEVLKVSIPGRYAYAPNDDAEKRLNKFAQYLKSALPWHMQWTLEYDFWMDYFIEDNDVEFHFLPPDADIFRYDADYNIDTAGLLIFEFRVIPVIPL